MKGKYAFLAVLLAVSGAALGVVGLVMRYVVLQPRGIDPQVPAVAIPILTLKEDLLAVDRTQTTVGRVLFIADPGICPAMGEGDHFCQAGMTVFDVGTRRIGSDTFRDSTLMELLSRRTYGAVVISLPCEADGYPAQSIGRAYQSLVDVVRVVQPQALILLQAVPGQPEINEQLRQIAQGQGIRYFEDMER